MAKPMLKYVVLILFQVLLIIQRVYLEICQSSSYGTVGVQKENGLRITGYIFETFDNMNVLLCAKECMIRPRCMSINVHNKGYRCELNERKKETAVIEMNPDWSYSERDNWPQELVGPCANTTCGSGKRCISLQDGNAVCVIYECVVDPPIVTNAYVRVLNRTVTGVTQYSCNTGYGTGPEDTMNITCQSNGQWTPVNFTCFRTCPASNYTYVSSIGLCVNKYNIEVTWSQAYTICTNEGAVLYIDDTTQKSAYIDSLVPINHVWLGAKRINNKITWQDNINNNVEVGSNGYTRWQSAEPDNNEADEDCLIRETTMKWYDRVCTYNYVFVCSTYP